MTPLVSHSTPLSRLSPVLFRFGLTLPCLCHLCPLVTFSLLFCLPLSFLQSLAMSAFVSVSTCPFLFCPFLLRVPSFLCHFLSVFLPFLGVSGPGCVTKGIPVGPGDAASRTCPASWTGAGQVCCSRAWHSGPI